MEMDSNKAVWPSQRTAVICQGLLLGDAIEANEPTSSAELTLNLIGFYQWVGGLKDMNGVPR